MPNTPRCDWCGKFTGEYGFTQQTEPWQLEPEDPELVCRKCQPIPDAGPTMRAVPWAQTEARLEAQREPGPAVPGKEV